MLTYGQKRQLDDVLGWERAGLSHRSKNCLINLSKHSTNFWFF